MTSINFEFIRPYQPELATLGGFAERYAHGDPQGALVKLRNFAEEFVKDLYVKLGLPTPVQGSLYDLTREISFKKSVPQVVLNKLDSLRVQGNKAAHGDKCSTTTALWILREAWDLAAWFYVAFCGGAKNRLPVYQEPAGDEQARKEKKLALEQLEAQEKQLAQLLAELEQERAKAKAAERTVEELHAAVAQGQQAAAALQFDEAATRKRLIDAELINAGWKIDPQGKSTEQVGQEIEVLHQQLPSGKGYADYVLWGDDGKPLAVIEAKKTSVDANAGASRPGITPRDCRNNTASARPSSTRTDSRPSSGMTR
jgi:type I restriction enzyme, R subunit